MIDSYRLPRKVPPNMAFQRTRRPSLRSGRSLRSLGSPLNAYPLGDLMLKPEPMHD